MTHPTDDELVIRFNNGDIEAFGKLFDRYSDRVFKYILTRVDGEETASDLTQDAFEKALRSLPKSKITSYFGSWLYGIAKHVVTDYYRQNSSQQVIEPFESLDELVGLDKAGHSREVEEMFDDQQEELKTKSELAEIMEQLSDNQRVVLELRKLEMLDIEQIASIFFGEDSSKNRHRVSDLVHKALKSAKRIKEHGQSKP